MKTVKPFKAPKTPPPKKLRHLIEETYIPKIYRIKSPPPCPPPI